MQKVKDIERTSPSFKSKFQKLDISSIQKEMQKSCAREIVFSSLSQYKTPKEKRRIQVRATFELQKLRLWSLNLMIQVQIKKILHLKNM